LPLFIARGKVAVLSDLVGAAGGTGAGAGLRVRFGAGAWLTAMTGAAVRLDEGLDDGMAAGEGRGLRVAAALLTGGSEANVDGEGALPLEGAVVAVLVDEEAVGVEATGGGVLPQALSASREATVRTAVERLTPCPSLLALAAEPTAGR
jgi:hypothetical protein